MATLAYYSYFAKLNLLNALVMFGVVACGLVAVYVAYRLAIQIKEYLNV